MACLHESCQSFWQSQRQLPTLWDSGRELAEPLTAQPHIGGHATSLNHICRRLAIPFSLPLLTGTMTFYDRGIFKDTLLPSFSLHGSFTTAAWAVGAATDRLDAKDWVWPAGFVANAWYSAVGRRLVAGEPLRRVLRTLSRPEWLLLAGASIWGGRLFYRVTSRAIARSGDDPRYIHAKSADGFSWGKALLAPFLLEAVVQSVIALPFTAPFRHWGAVLTGYHPWVQALAVGIFSTGFALEVAADAQLEKHRQEHGTSTMLREGVWSIVRHPNYLGDALIHLSFPVLLYASDMLAPVELLGPVANYLYLRFVGGDKELEQYQRRRYSVDNAQKMAQFDEHAEEKNAFWPALKELNNPWTWTVLGCGVAGAVIERGIWTALGHYH